MLAPACLAASIRLVPTLTLIALPSTVTLKWVGFGAGAGATTGGGMGAEAGFASEAGFGSSAMARRL